MVVKLGSANIDILGDITAQKGFVNALASARNEFDTGDLLSLIPLSFGMGDVEAKVTLGGEARDQRRRWRAIDERYVRLCRYLRRR